MKILIFVLGIFSFLFGESTKEILKMIDILNNKNFSYKEISGVYNPFTKNGVKGEKNNINKVENITPTLPQTNSSYNLEVIFQNKVRINNNWYKNGDKLDSYNIIIVKNKVYLKNKHKLILLNRKTLIKVK